MYVHTCIYVHVNIEMCMHVYVNVCLFILSLYVHKKEIKVRKRKHATIPQLKQVSGLNISILFGLIESHLKSQLASMWSIFACVTRFTLYEEVTCFLLGLSLLQARTMVTAQSFAIE